MGNIHPTSLAPRTYDGDSTLKDVYDFHKNKHGKIKKYEPSQYQVDTVYNAMKNAALFECSPGRGARMMIMDEKLLLRKLRPLLWKENPEFFLLQQEKNGADDIDDGVGVVGVGSSNKRMVQGGGPPVTIHGLPVPDKVIMDIVSYCDGWSSCKFSESCKDVYGVIQDQVEFVHAQLIDAYQQTISQWFGMDLGLFWIKLRSKIWEEYPVLFPSSSFSPSSSIAVSCNNEKKKKVEGGPIILQGLRVPKEVIEHILPCCDRVTTNRFGETCRGVHQVIQDPRVFKKLQWPDHCPWYQTKFYRRDFRSSNYFVASTVVGVKDMARFAVVRYQSTKSEFHSYAHLEIWDRSRGLIGELDWHHNPLINSIKPVFSPDGELFLAPLGVRVSDAHARIVGVQVVKLPSYSEKGPIMVVEHQVRTAEGSVSSFEFVNNDTFVWNSYHAGIVLWRVNRCLDNCGNIGVSYLRSILQDQIQHQRIGWLASFMASETTTLLAVGVVPDRLDLGQRGRIIFYDLATNESLIKNNPLQGHIAGVDFSPDGKLLFSFRHRVNISVYDCSNVKAIGEIGHPRSIRLRQDQPVRYCYFGGFPLFSKGGTKAVVTFLIGRLGHQNNLIDMQKEEIDSHRFLVGDKWDQSSWKTIAHQHP